MDDRFQVLTRSRAAAARCPACRQQDRDEQAWPPPEHTCRRLPATPAATLADRARRARATRIAHEAEVRARRLSDLHYGIR